MTLHTELAFLFIQRKIEGMDAHPESGRKSKSGRVRVPAEPLPPPEKAKQFPALNAQKERRAVDKLVTFKLSDNVRREFAAVFGERTAGPVSNAPAESQDAPDPELEHQQQVRLQTEYRNFRTLVERTIEVFGDPLKASLWLSTPSVDLDGKVPMQIAQSVQYTASALDQIFEPIFIRIEHGIYT